MTRQQIALAVAAALLALVLWLKTFWRKSRTARDGDPPLLWLGNDLLTMHDAYTGFIAIGSIGSGKTSGPGDHVVRALMAHESRPGFLFLTAKPGEYERVRGMCEATGRLGDLVRFGPGSGTKCDFLNYEMSHPYGSAEAAAAYIAAIQQLSSRQGEGGGGDQVFFQKTAERFTRAMIETVFLAKGKVSFSCLYRFLTSCANSLAERDSAEWRAKSFAFECVREMAARSAELPSSNVALNAEIWLKEWCVLAEKTRSIIYTMISSTIDNFLTSASAEMVSSGETNFTPEDIADGAICVLDMPVLRWREPGRYFQVLFKMLVQRYALRRQVTPCMRPIVVVQDEAQLFLTDFDVEVQTVARESRLINFLLTQSLPVMYEAMGGGPRAEQLTHALLGNIQCKFICQQSDKTTNEYFSGLIGESIHHFMSGNMPTGRHDLVGDVLGFDAEQGQRGSIGFNSQMRAKVLPSDFCHLAKGSKAHNYVVECIAFMGGKPFVSNRGKTWAKIEFQQRRQ